MNTINPPPGKLVVVTGPSGVGKGTLIGSLLELHPQVCLSVSATTRLPRPQEIPGKDYHFLSRDEFQQLIEQDKLLEWAEYAGNYYGTPRQSVEEQIEQGRIVILEIEVVGARQIRHSFAEARQIFILPPSWEELEQRLRARGTDSEQAIAKRLEQAQIEINASNEFDQLIINQELTKALEELELAILGPSPSQG